jgi:hypothetical protein
MHIKFTALPCGLAQVSTSAIHAVGHGKAIVTSRASSVPRPHPLPQGPRMIRDAPRMPPTLLAPPTLRPPEVPPSTRSGDGSHSRDTRLPPVAERGRVNGLREPDQGLLGAEGRGAEARGTAERVVPEARVRPPSVIMRPPSRGPRFPAPLLSPWRQYALSAFPSPSLCSSLLEFVIHGG